MPIIPIGISQAAQGGGGSVWDKLAGALGGGTFAGIGTAVGGPIGGAIGGGVDLASKIAGLFQESPDERAQGYAAESMQMFIDSAAAIADRVNKGGLNPATALRMLNGLYNQAQSYGTTTHDLRGMQVALSMINNIIGNVQEQYNWKIVGTGDVNKGAERGLGGYFQDPTMQKDWIGQQLRNKLLGFEEGSRNLAGSPLEKMFKPAFDPYSQVGTAMETVKGVVPSYREPARFEQIRKKLWEV